MPKSINLHIAVSIFIDADGTVKAQTTLNPVEDDPEATDSALTTDEELKSSLNAVFSRVKSKVSLAKQLGISRSAVHQWQCVPIKHVAAVSKITGLSPAQIRPDFSEAFPKVSL